MRQYPFQTVVLDYQGKDLEVSADYYQEDGIRMPVGLTKAFEIASRYGFYLPNKDIVDFIWESADVRLKPVPLSPGPEMTTLAYFKKHDKIIEDQLKTIARPDKKPLLVAGHKKDILFTEYESPKVTIYGWHRENGKPIQPVSSVHHREYCDYSHGLRLVRFV